MCLEPQLQLVDVGADTKLGTQPLNHLPSLMRGQFSPVQMSCRGRELVQSTSQPFTKNLVSTLSRFHSLENSRHGS